MSGKGPYTLHYFNVTGRGEAIRWILAYGKANWEDKRFSRDEWPKHKPNMPISQAPVLEFTSGKEKVLLPQSAAIANYLAHQLGLAGKDPLQQARAVEAVESIRELQEAIFRGMFEPDATRKEEAMKKIATEHAPRILGYLEQRLKANNNKNLAGGDGLTYADLFLASFFDMLNGKGMVDVNAVCPGLAAHYKTISETPDIKAYIAKRPKTDM